MSYQLVEDLQQKALSVSQARRVLKISRSGNCAANQAWVCDITYIRRRSGWLYLAAVMDLHWRSIKRY